MSLYEQMPNNRQFISKSTNEVYKFELNGKKYVYKENTQGKEMSSFWYHQKKLYGQDYNTYVNELKELYDSLKNNEYIKAAKLVEYSIKDRYQIFECVDGKTWELDEFPMSFEIAQTLGRYIATFHKNKYQNYGTIGNHTRTNFKKYFFETIRNQIQEFWNDSEEILKKIKVYEDKFKEPTSFSLIMTDISGNQFIYNNDLMQILYNVDFDAYVVGPPEIELIIIKDCMSKECFERFKESYEEILPMPSLDNEEIYKYCFSLNESSKMVSM